jgi:hypothetical protein
MGHGRSDGWVHEPADDIDAEPEPSLAVTAALMLRGDRRAT